MLKARIAGIGSYLPSRTVPNAEMFPYIKGFDPALAAKSLTSRGIDASAMKDAEIFDHWVQQVTGICKRTWLTENEFPKDFAIEHMAAVASKKALADAGITILDIDHIIFSTYSGETVIPQPAATLSNLLECGPISGITINGACSGFLDALIDASIKIESGLFKNILIVASERLSDKIDFSDVTTAILFSDGAGAAVVSADPIAGIYSFSSRLRYNNEHISMARKENIQMGGGPQVLRKAVTAMHEVSMDALSKSGLDLNSIECIVPHQANTRILSALEEKFSLPAGCRMVKCIGETGNLSSATIPVALDMLKKGRFSSIPYRKGMKTILTSVGGGYTYSAAVVEL